MSVCSGGGGYAVQEPVLGFCTAFATLNGWLGQEHYTDSVKQQLCSDIQSFHFYGIKK